MEYKDGLYLVEDITESESKGILTLCARSESEWYLLSLPVSLPVPCLGDDKDFLKNGKPLTYFPGVECVPQKIEYMEFSRTTPPLNTESCDACFQSMQARYKKLQGLQHARFDGYWELDGVVDKLKEEKWQMELLIGKLTKPKWWQFWKKEK